MGRKHKQQKVKERSRKKKEKIQKSKDAAGLYRDRSVSKALNKKKKNKGKWHWLQAPKLSIGEHERSTKEIETPHKHKHVGYHKFVWPKGQPNKKEVERAVKLAAKTARRDERRYRDGDVPEDMVTEAVTTKIAMPQGGKLAPASSLIGDAKRVYQNALKKEARLREKLHNAAATQVHELHHELAAARRQVIVDKAGLEVVQRQVMKKSS